MPHRKPGPRLADIGNLIKKGKIKTFHQVFDHIPPTVIAKSLRWGNSRINNIIVRPGRLTLEEVYKLAGMFKCGEEQLLRVVMEEVKG